MNFYKIITLFLVLFFISISPNNLFADNHDTEQNIVDQAKEINEELKEKQAATEANISSEIDTEESLPLNDPFAGDASLGSGTGIISGQTEEREEMSLYNFKLVGIMNGEYESYVSLINATGEVVKFTSDVIAIDGTIESREVVRVGVFNAVSDGDYLSYASTRGMYEELPSQPAGRYTATTSDVFYADEFPVQFAVDPTGPQGGSYLASLISMPGWGERTTQGGIVGYIILYVLGLGGLALFAWRLYALREIRGAVDAQLKASSLSMDNPLGRVLKIAEDNPKANTETLELKMAEQILTERPSIEKLNWLVKLISIVAPLMGLFGTIIGMIIGSNSVCFDDFGLSMIVWSTVNIISLLTEFPALSIPNMEIWYWPSAISVVLYEYVVSSTILSPVGSKNEIFSSSGKLSSVNLRSMKRLFEIEVLFFGKFTTNTGGSLSISKLNDSVVS